MTATTAATAPRSRNRVSLSQRGAENGVPSATAIDLLELEPELSRLMTPEQCAAAGRFLLPIATVEKGGDLAALVDESGGFGALVLDGLLLQTVQIGERQTLRLIGPGALVPMEGAPDWMPVALSAVLPADRTRVVVLDNAFLIAAHRWPWLVVCLHNRMLEQSARLTAQLAISHLPRVHDRLMAMLQLLAESWGRMTPAGISLQLSLSHETLGQLIGARRPTVTLALKELAERNSLIRQGKGWLIIGE
jgi:CRP/FNR family transcriptional regulator, cyclic AMP receptor protein